MRFPNKETVERLRREYPAGTRGELVQMDDSQAPPIGTKGTVEGVEKSYAIQAGREVRIMVLPEKINDERMTIVAREIAQRIENEMDYPGQIKINLIRESRAVEYAK